MSSREQLATIKRATVAVAVMHDVISPVPVRNPPFTILGSGFCVHEKGVVLTCKHVIEGFLTSNIADQMSRMKTDAVVQEGGTMPVLKVKAYIPHALFYVPVDEHRILVAAVGIKNVLAKPNSPMD